MRRKKVMVVILCALLLVGALAIADVSLGQQKALADEATFYSTASDGLIYGWNSSYNTAHGTASMMSYGLANLYIGQQLSTIYQIGRSAVFFDTSSLPDSAIITAATLSLSGMTGIAGDGSDTDFDITVVDGSSLNDPLELADYEYLRTRTTSGGAFDTTPGFSTTGYNDIQLNAAGMGWISKTGMTQLGLRSSRDINADDSFPNADEWVNVFSSEWGSDIPKLVVTYYIPLASVPTLSQWGMIGMAIVLGAFLAWSVRRRLVVSSDNS